MLSALPVFARLFPRLAGAVAILLVIWSGSALAESYRKAPPAIAEILDAPPAPVVSISPTRDTLMLVQGVRYPPVDELAEPMLRLAGQRINPRNNGPHRAPRYVSVTLKTLTNNVEIKVSLPAGARIGFPDWSPDGKQFAFAKYDANRIELWVGNTTNGAVRKLPNVVLNAAFGEPFKWMPDSETLLCQLVLTNRGAAPVPPVVAPGPTVQETTGQASPARTYPDLLENPNDEDLFDYYATSQLAFVGTHKNGITYFADPAVYTASDPSPDGEHVLIVRLHRPYSYQLPAAGFPREVDVWERNGKPEYRLASLPLAEGVPIDGVPTGPRRYHWIPTELATLAWVEALDKGDPKLRSPHRDRILMLKAPFTGEAQELVRLQNRFSSISWLEKGRLAIVREYQSSRRWARTYLVDGYTVDQEPKLLWERSTEDRYNDPGSPMMRTLPQGKRAVRLYNNGIYLSGNGASPDGEKPFLDRFDLDTLKAERLFQSGDRRYESVVALVSDDASQFVTRAESTEEPPNYYLRSNSDNRRTMLTEFTDPAPLMRKVTKQLVTYERADGVQLSFTLYLPPNYQPGERLPTILWAYPREFADADNAGQIAGSTNRFTTVSGASHLLLLLEGYAILDGATMPVVGAPKTANDTFIEQIVSSARAAIDKAVEMGVTDPNRVGVGGHSYGAFMVANLLANSDLFRAGVARSGAYNRTLTPFGFQNETRSMWEAPDVYLKLSPFMMADKINEPLLLIHGEADNNSGTFPMQSDRLYQAIKGNGGTSRLVMLPYEAHTYEARESIEHTLAEMIAWYDRYVKNASPRPMPMPMPLVTPLVP